MSARVPSIWQTNGGVYHGYGVETTEGPPALGDVLRYTSAKDNGPATIDGFPNFYHVTESAGPGWVDVLSSRLSGYVYHPVYGAVNLATLQLKG